jgi:hypothetical protein
MNNAARQAQYQAEAAARLQQMRLQEYPRRNNGQLYVPGYRRRVHSNATLGNLQRAANNAARRAPLNRLADAPTPGIKGWFRRTLGLEGGGIKRRKTRRGRK